MTSISDKPIPDQSIPANQRDTAETMHDTAEALERSEAILHDSAESSPDAATTRRLHALGDEVTRQAKAIDRRADAIGPRDSGRPEIRAAGR
jgi:hypothetical protein